ncbi:TIGR03749 family integrating conjugative element protein [Pseudomonas sp. Y39-6]|uniref:TIGR03749 family integrating conjugative element protein n=1 Tax=Pseudomonas sp. Y39-6 TaxID=2749807 RepID=UPI0019105891|nr:TIGR03749 family integrating conjugative element protein [Pseudomonas sp. Y39-6]QPO21841.1 TIGR03749 family integrating conjugative element protein [Pseudomonas sp. Y39-6]URS59151.1 TIGR03749 family integrating conjugative element protein [Pseudomonas sp. Y39-6]
MKRIFTLGLIVALMLWGAAAQAVELMHWERLPLAVPLVINQERVVFVDENVRVGVPSSLAGKLRVQSTGGSLYLRASEAIAPTRLQLQSVATGEIILLDIAATPSDQPLEPVRILKNAPVQATETESSTVPVPARTPIPVALTRYAAQSLYAQLRTVESLPGIRRVPLKLRTELPTLLPTENVSSIPIAAWRLGDYWVTAVKLRNHGSETVQLDPRRLQAKLFAASFQHVFLGPVGTAEDTTVAYLVTRGAGLEQAVLLIPSVTQGGGHER